MRKYVRIDDNEIIYLECIMEKIHEEGRVIKVRIVPKELVIIKNGEIKKMEMTESMVLAIRTQIGEEREIDVDEWY